MAIKVRCHHCKTVFYEGLELVTPEAIINRIGARCPCCYAPLSIDPSKIRISIPDPDVPMWLN
jgi:hypothetical protein